MAFFDLSLDELKKYLPPRTELPTWDSFWAETLAQTRIHSLDARFVPFECGLQTLEVFDVTFNGYGGHPIKGWLLLPRHRNKPLPCVVEYLGYNGGRSFPTQYLIWASAGFAHLVMDTRGQGSGWLNGDTPDPDPSSGTPQFPGFMTRGILNPQTYYYRRVFSDAVRAVEAARAHPAIDRERIAVTGVSQGGGIAIAVSGLEPTIKACLPDVPFLCHYRRATHITNAAPYSEIVNYCKIHRDHVDAVFQTLTFFDGVNFAVRARAKAFFSAGLMDEICPPSTVFAAYNYYGGPKQISVYEFNQHDGGGAHQIVKKIEFLADMWSDVRTGGN